MESQFTANLDEVIGYVLANCRGTRCYKDHGDLQIQLDITLAAMKQNLYVMRDGKTITGMIIASIIDDNSFEVSQLLCTSPQAFKDFRALGRSKFAGRKCVYQRRGHDRTLTKY